MFNKIDNKRFFGVEDVFKGESVKVINASPVFEYVDNKKTDNRVATYLEVVDMKDYSKYRIKFPLSFQPFEYLEKEIFVHDLVNFKATLYCRSNKVYWSLKADEIN